MGPAAVAVELQVLVTDVDDVAGAKRPSGEGWVLLDLSPDVVRVRGVEFAGVPKFRLAKKDPGSQSRVRASARTMTSPAPASIRSWAQASATQP